MKDRYTDVSDKVKIVMLEAENEAMAEMLSEAIDGLAQIDSTIQHLRHALHLGLDETEQPVDQK